MLTIAELRTVVADAARSVEMDGRCRYLRAAGGEGAVASTDGYPTEESATVGLREQRSAIGSDRCRSAGAGDESYVCTQSSGPVGAVGFVRHARIVMRLDIVGPTETGRVAELLRIAAARL